MADEELARRGDAIAVFPSLVTSPAAARSFVRSALADVAAEVVVVVEMCTSELVTNAVIHGGGVGDHRTIEVTVGFRPGVVRVQVRDAGAGMPVVRPPSPGSSGGRGLLLVEGFCSQWGCNPEPGGKGVWFEVRDQASRASALSEPSEV